MKKIALLLLLIISSSLHASETRIALVLGNADYSSSSIGRLSNSTNDANDMAQALSELGFEVIKGIDLNKKQMSQKIRDFDKRLKAGDKQNTVGLFYYAGHGLEVQGKNYLIPTNAEMQFQEDASDEGIPLNRVLNNLSYAGNRMNIVILDACRNNPLPKRDRAISSGGWSSPSDASGMFIAYGTAPGRTAADSSGNGRNGLYTKHILANIKKPGRTLEQVFKAIRQGVLTDSNKKQKTGQYNETTGDDFYFVPPTNNTIASIQPSTRPIQSNPISTYTPPTRQIGEPYKDCDETYCPTMVDVPAGSFQMGSKDGQSDEKPVHRVTIKQFSMSQTEVTFAQWDACYNAGGCSHNPKDEGWGRDNRPVINVSWNDAQEYIKWLNKKTGKRYRLPSESEWEYAARAGSSSKYSWGDKISCNKAQYDGGENSKCYYKPNGKYRGTAEVKSYQVNEFGLYDMHGNVWEWVEDKYHNTYNGSPKDGSAWTSGSSPYRVLRGGSWNYEAVNLRSAKRYGYNAARRYNGGGFRLAQDSK